ncbi:hypothetical protein A3K79_00525 [Candidatus Bathyarchaeota archaeon RBG_13_46_16b]|nr:MAG: hypothetical protein A3K79_00525 [Candidatus Bathyarchaeota archaeon RBG_13_46_16b]
MLHGYQVCPYHWLKASGRDLRLPQEPKRTCVPRRCTSNLGWPGKPSNEESLDGRISSFRTRERKMKWSERSRLRGLRLKARETIRWVFLLAG